MLPFDRTYNVEQEFYQCLERVYEILNFLEDIGTKGKPHPHPPPTFQPFSNHSTINQNALVLFIFFVLFHLSHLRLQTWHPRS